MNGGTDAGSSGEMLPGGQAPGRADRPSRRALLVLGGFVAAAGVPLGLLWAGLTPRVPVRAVNGAVAYVGAQPEQPFAADGWFTLLAAAFGVIAAGVAWSRARTRGVAGLVVLVVAAVVAGALAWAVGRQVGLAGYESALAVAVPEQVLQRPADLRVAEAGWWPPRLLGAPLVPAFTAAVTYTLLAAWSRYATLRADGPEW